MQCTTANLFGIKIYLLSLYLHFKVLIFQNPNKEVENIQLGDLTLHCLIQANILSSGKNELRKYSILDRDQETV